MKKNFMRSVLLVVLTFVLVVSFVFPGVSGATYRTYKWFDYIDRLIFDASSKNLTAYVQYDISDSWWRYDQVSYIGKTFEFKTSSTVDLTLYAGSYVDLSVIENGTIFNLGLSFEVDEEYSGVGFEYYISIAYYDSGFNYISADRSGLNYYDVDGEELVCSFTADGFSSVNGAPSRSKYCRFFVHISAPGGISVRAGVNYLSAVIQYDSALALALTPEDFQALGTKTYRLWDLHKDVWYPDEVEQAFLETWLEGYFGSRDDFVLTPDFEFDFESGQFELDALLNNALEFLSSVMGVFAAVSAMFTYLFQIPYISSILFVSLAVGIGAYILGLTFNVNVRSEAVEKGSPGRKDSMSRNAKFDAEGG